MTDATMSSWKLIPAGLFRGLYHGYDVTANRHRTDGNTLVWHVRVRHNDNSGDIRTYWIKDGTFYGDSVATVGPDGSVNVTVGELVEPSVQFKEAVLAATSKWHLQR